jgi:hypothetical protein
MREALLAGPYIFHEPNDIGLHTTERLGRHPGLAKIPDQHLELSLSLAASAKCAAPALKKGRAY